MTTSENASFTRGVPVITTRPRKLQQPAATVSRAFSSRQAISASTRQRVSALPHQFHLQPDAHLHQSPSQLLGVIVPAIGNGHFPNLLQGIEKAASRAGFNIVICQSADDTLLERRHVDTLLNAQVAGLLVAASSNTTDFQYFEQLHQHGIALVHFGNVPAHSAVNAVITDDYGGGYQATRHLLEQGCMRIAHLAGPQHLARCRQLREGYLDALARAGLAADERLICYSGLQFEDGVVAMRRLLRLPSAPTGVFGASHAVMAGALQVLKGRKIAVPRQIALAGFSNDDTYSPLVPELTSVGQLSEEMGQAAVGLLLEIVAAGTAFVPRQVLLHPSLVMRASSFQQPATR